MPLETLDRIRSLKAIEHEYRVACIAMRRLADQARHDPTILDKDMRFRGIGEALSNLNGTYAIRLFAEFETGLRKFWVTTRFEPEPRSIAEIIKMRQGDPLLQGREELPPPSVLSVGMFSATLIT